MLVNFLLSVVLWVQVPQWSDDWSKCAIDVPDAACHWYVAAPDNTFGEGFNWADAPWFDAYGLKAGDRALKGAVGREINSAERVANYM